MNVTELVGGVRDGSRTALGRAITLIESRRADHREQAQELLLALLSDCADASSTPAVRLGITGVPGVGKSTFIDELGTQLTTAGHRVAVLAVDPSSSRTGGSILGDKTRMERLSADSQAFIRASPASGELGGVGRATREAIIVVEAAGFDVVLVETVGVGQSETLVADMVDSFCVLMLPGAGDELQGIKKGVLELADVVAVNKADANPAGAAQAVADYSAALRLLEPAQPWWNPPVCMVSALTGDGVDAFWQLVVDHRAGLHANGAFDAQRRDQQVRWMWSLVDMRLRSALRSDQSLAALVDTLSERVTSNDMLAPVAADELVAALRRGPSPKN